MNLFDKAKEKLQRHTQRHTALDFQYAFADCIDFLNGSHWDEVAVDKTIFLSREYLSAIEQYPPENTRQRYAIAYSMGKPVLILACQLADISGDRLASPEGGVAKVLSKQYKERVIVCGNLVSSGLHGVAFSKQINEDAAWRIAAEILYKIRRAEKLAGVVNFSIIKDIKGDQTEVAKTLERYSYRKIQTDPDMVLQLAAGVQTFDDYLAMLSSKYRNRIKKIQAGIEQAGLVCKKLIVDEACDEEIHKLYLNVESRAKTRLATLPKGYFKGLADNLGDRFACYGIQKGETIIGFVTVLKDSNIAVAYYVGFDYQQNEQQPIYFRLLQLVIECAINMQCSEVHFGRSALEPKANLGAKPVETYVWARHRVPVVNYFVRKLFRNVPFDEAPERSAMKGT